MKMTKMDMCWIATALLLYPHTESSFLVSEEAIHQKVKSEFDVELTPVMITRHFVSWVDRQADKNYPKQGGSRNRYLFKTSDGIRPSEWGEFRLYKQRDGQYDGIDKTNKYRPQKKDIQEKYHYLVDWHDVYYGS